MYKVSEFTKPVYKAGEIAKMLGITTQTLRVYEDSGRIPYFRSEGGHRLVKREDLLSFLDEKGILADNSGDRKRDVIYACAPSSGELDAQVLQVVTGWFTLQNLYVIRDAGDSTDEAREGIRRLVGMVLDDEVRNIYVTRKSVLAGEGLGYLEFVFQRKGVSVFPLCDSSMTHD